MAVSLERNFTPNEMRLLENISWEEIIDGSNNVYKLTSDFIWSKSINTPFINKTLIGMVDKTIVDGNVIFENRK